MTDMRGANHQLKPIEFKVRLAATPSSVFRALTSQTELRRWWAPRVIMSRNTVSQEEGRDIEMRLLSAEKYTSVRYSWRGLDWPEGQPGTVINFDIVDLGVFRGQTGEGIELDVMHDGWFDEAERARAEAIWKAALQGLRALLEGKNFRPWWEGMKQSDGFRETNLNAALEFIRSLDLDSRGKQDKKIAGQNLVRICQELEGSGSWFMKDNRAEFEFRAAGIRFFSIHKNLTLAMHWREVEKILGDRLQDFANRLIVEQDLDVHIGKSQDKIQAVNLNPLLLSRWCMDVIRVGSAS